MTEADWERMALVFTPEKESILATLKRGVERYPQTKEILFLLGAGTFLTASLIFPGLPRLAAPLLNEWQGYQRKRLGQNLKRLKRQKLVEIIEEDGGSVVKITERGISRALRYKLGEMKIKKPRAWDKKWRLIVFDIAEKKKWFREVFRGQLEGLGLFRLQESVYVFPYPCFEEIEFLRQIYRIPFEVKYIVAERIESAEELKEHFNL